MAKVVSTVTVYLGTDHALVFTIKNAAETACLDITSYTLTWMLKRYVDDADGSAILTKTLASGIAISGTFNSDPDVNTQVATVTILDTETDSVSPGLYYQELKRTDAGLEAVLAVGPLDFVKGVHG